MTTHLTAPTETFATNHVDRRPMTVLRPGTPSQGIRKLNPCLPVPRSCFAGNRVLPGHVTAWCTTACFVKYWLIASDAHSILNSSRSSARLRFVGSDPSDSLALGAIMRSRLGATSPARCKASPANTAWHVSCLRLLYADSGHRDALGTTKNALLCITAGPGPKLAKPLMFARQICHCSKCAASAAQRRSLRPGGCGG